MKRFQGIFGNTFTLLLLLLLAATTVLILNKQNFIGSEQGVETQTVVATQETGMTTVQSPLAPPIVTPTPKPPIDVSKLEITNVEQVAPSPFYYSLLSPDSRYALVNKNEAYQGHQLAQANDGDPIDGTGTWIRTHDLWLVDQKTKEETLIASNATNWWWAPDSSAFSYVTPVEKHGIAGRLYVSSPLEKAPRQIANVDLVLGYTQGVWLSPEEIMYIADGRLWAMQRDGSNNRPLHNLRLSQIGSDQVEELAEYTGNVDEFVISPDGKRIAYTLSIPGPGHPRESHIGSKSELWVSDIDGQNPILITDDGIVLDWSPDGNQIIYSSTAFPEIERTAARNLNIVNLKTGEQHILYKASTGFSGIDNFTWAPRGDALVLRELIPGGGDWSYNLWFTNPDGSKQKTFQNLEVISQPNIWMTWEENENEDYLSVTTPSSAEKQKQVHRVKLTTSP